MARRGSAEIHGLDDLERAIQRIGKVPQTAATKAARAGAAIALKAAKRNAPTKTTNLVSGIIMKREKRKKQGKTMYDIMLDPAKTEEFVKDVDNPSPYNRSNDPTRAYYPASQEYGFMTANGRLIPGKRYLRRSITENKESIESKVINVGVKEIDKAWEAR